jgi:hypothetical protein
VHSHPPPPPTLLPPPHPFWAPPPILLEDNHQIFLSKIHRELLNKLADTESNANDIIHKLSLLKEYLRQEANKENLKLTKRVENDRNELIRKIELFEMNNRDLRDIIYDLTTVEQISSHRKRESSSSSNELKRDHDVNELLKQLEALEGEKNVIYIYFQKKQYYFL